MFILPDVLSFYWVWMSTLLKNWRVDSLDGLTNFQFWNGRVWLRTKTSKSLYTLFSAFENRCLSLKLICFDLDGVDSPGLVSHSFHDLVHLVVRVATGWIRFLGWCTLAPVWGTSGIKTRFVARPGMLFGECVCSSFCHFVGTWIPKGSCLPVTMLKRWPDDLDRSDTTLRSVEWVVLRWLSYLTDWIHILKWVDRGTMIAFILLSISLEITLRSSSCDCWFFLIGRPCLRNMGIAKINELSSRRSG